MHFVLHLHLTTFNSIKGEEFIESVSKIKLEKDLEEKYENAKKFFKIEKQIFEKKNKRILIFRAKLTWINLK